MFFGHHKYHAEHLPVVYSCINTTLFYLYFIACHYRLKDLECPQDNGAASPPRIIDESWLFGQVSGSASTWLICSPPLGCAYIFIPQSLNPSIAFLYHWALVTANQICHTTCGCATTATAADAFATRDSIGGQVATLVA